MNKLDEKLMMFMELVLAGNERVNLTTVTDRNAFVERHLADSLMCRGLPEMEAAKTVVDIGTGAGFPGVPLAVRYPEKAFLLVDASNKRVTFLKEAVDSLGLENVRVLHARAEDAGRMPDLRERFDLCVSRAVSHLSILSEYCLPFVRVGGAFYAWKTDKAVESGELEESARARQLLGGATDAKVLRAPQTPAPEGGRHAMDSFGAAECSPNLSGHNIIIVKKEGPTPDAYPRRAGVPARAPL